MSHVLATPRAQPVSLACRCSLACFKVATVQLCVRVCSRLCVLWQAGQLAKLLRSVDMHSHVNLIPWNPVPGLNFERPSNNCAHRFQRELQVSTTAPPAKTEDEHREEGCFARLPVLL